jgi:hypothetical protein
VRAAFDIVSAIKTIEAAEPLKKGDRPF